MEAIQIGIDESLVLLSGLHTAARGSDASILALPSSAPALWRDLSVCAVFSLFFFIVNWGLRFLIDPILQRVFKMTRTQRQKFAQSALEVVFYGTFTILGLCVVPRQEWAWPSDSWWKGFANGGHEVMRSDLRCYYLMYVSRYFQGAISVLMEHKRKDFLEMQIHHWTTVSLITVSYVYGWNRVGSMVMLILDPADVLLHSAKMCKYASDSYGKGFQKKLWQNGADVLFALFAVVFFLTRLVMYPYVCWSAYEETKRHFVKGVSGWTCIVLLDTLLVLQIYWFYLLCQAIWRLIIKGGVEDVRSDDEDEEPEKEAKKKE